MIQLEDAVIKFLYMGLFTIDRPWIHPEIIKDSYEIIYVTEGRVCMFEAGTDYALETGDLLLLRPHEMHRGYEYSSGKTSFYWVHFTLNHKKTGEPWEGKTLYLPGFTGGALFKELLHYSYLAEDGAYLREITLLYLLGKIVEHNPDRKMNKLAAEVFEWTRINASHDLTVEKVAGYFQYHKDYLSRIISCHYHMPLRDLINSFVLLRAKNYLCNTSLTIKEISNLLKFPTANSFVNYYKYHERMTPSEYRNTYINVSMNNK